MTKPRLHFRTLRGNWKVGADWYSCGTCEDTPPYRKLPERINGFAVQLLCFQWCVEWRSE